MSRYSARQKQTVAEAPQIHAIWRGIGCLLALIIPAISWVLAAFTMQYALDSGLPVPYQLVGYPVMPQVLWKVPYMPPVLTFIQGQPNLYGVIVLWVIYMLILGGIMSFAYAFTYRFVGPPRYGPLDAPPPKISIQRYKR